MQIELIVSHVERMPSYDTLYALRGSLRCNGEVHHWQIDGVPAEGLASVKERIARDLVTRTGITTKIKELI